MGLNVNKAIKKVGSYLDDVMNGNSMFSGITESVRSISRGKSGNMINAGVIERGADGKFMHVADELAADVRNPWQKIKQAHMVDDPNGWDNVGGYSAKKIAGSYMGIAAAGRVVTGGGIYRDSEGNGNLIGVPFI